MSSQITGDIGRGTNRRKHRPGKYLLEAVCPSIELNPLRSITECWLDKEWNPDLRVLGWRRVLRYAAAVVDA